MKIPTSAGCLSYGTKTLAALALVASSSLASAATIDFDGLDASPGQAVPLLSFSEDGYTFGVSFTTTDSSPGPVLFDTTCNGAACNGDEDLVPAVQGENGIAGNVLVLQENGSNIPDDTGGGGSITLTLLSGPAFEWLGFSAVDDATFTASTVADGVLGAVSLISDSETGMVAFNSSLIGVGQSITLDYSGSGGIDSLVVQAVPLPAALPLFLSALAGMSFAGMRRRKK